MIRQLLFALCISLASTPIFGQYKAPQQSTNTYNLRSSTLLDTKNLTFVISAKDIPNKDYVDTVDPFIKLYQSSKTQIEPEKFGTTEVVENSVDPEYTTTFWFIWKKGTGQKWNFKVRDQDDLRPDDHLGEADIDVDEYVNKGEILNVSLSDGGSLLVQKTTPIKFKLYGRSLPRKDPFSGKSDPFVKCYWRRGSNGDPIKFFTTEVVDNVENVDWNSTIEFPNYIKGTDLWWLFKVRDSDGTSGDDDLGEALVEIDQFVEKRQTKILRLGDSGKATLGLVPIS